MNANIASVTSQFYAKHRTSYPTAETVEEEMNSNYVQGFVYG